MKQLQKWLPAIILSFFLLSSFTLSGGDEGEKISFYHTLDDYMKGKTTSSWENFVRHGFYFDATIDGKKVKRGSFDNVDDWGYVDSKGTKWRISKAYGELQIVCTGKIWLYGLDNVQFTGQNQSVAVTNFVLDRNQWGVYASLGGNDKGDWCDGKLLQKYMADDPAMVQKIKDAGGLKLSKFKEWGNDFKTILSLVNEYNSKHK